MFSKGFDTGRIAVIAMVALLVLIWLAASLLQLLRLGRGLAC
ncbi:MAG: hypothetical protein ACKVJD_05435 [Burkholderiales bacterium]